MMQIEQIEQIELRTKHADPEFCPWQALTFQRADTGGLCG
jgi:hypothetical protein